MEGRLSVLSVQRSAVTEVPFVVYGRQAYCSVCGTQFCDCSTHCNTIYSSKIVQKKMQKCFLLFLPQMQNCVRWKFGVSEGGEKRGDGRGDIGCVRGRGGHG